MKNKFQSRLFTNKIQTKPSNYLKVAVIFYGGFILLGIIPIHIIIPALVSGVTTYLTVGSTALSSLSVISLIGINLIYIFFQRLMLIHKINATKILVKQNISTSFSKFKLQILDLDGSVTKQYELLAEQEFTIIPMQEWGKKIRLLCSFSTFRQFEIELGRQLNKQLKQMPSITLLGSNDFDHVTLALLRQISTPFNLLFFDKHADWNPFFLTDVMCGSWLYHAFSATNMRTVFHVGGSEKAFDATGDIFDAVECFGNGRGIQKYIDAGRIVCLPAIRSFNQNPYVDYEQTINQPVKISTQVCRQRLKSLISQYQEQLKSMPLFIAIDKDVLAAQDNVQSWEPGELFLEDIESIIYTFLELCNYHVVGVSVCGDYSESNYNNFFQFRNIIEKLALSHGVRVEVNQSKLTVNEETNIKLIFLLMN